MTDEQAVRALTVLAQMARIQLLRALMSAAPEGLTPSVMARNLGLSPTAMSFHLKELVSTGFASVAREGRHLIYQAEPSRMNELMSYLTDTCCGGQLCHLSNLQGVFMSSRVLNVLFLCTGNSARSIMAESILNQLGAGRFRAYSAGSHPSGQVNPMAMDLLQRNHYPVKGLRSKNWDEFARPDAPQMDFVITVCDKAAGEVCPLWPGQPMSAHWGVPDPVEQQGTPEEVNRAFTDAFMVLNRRLSLFTVLPIEKLDRLALQRELQNIALTQ